MQDYSVRPNSYLRPASRSAPMNTSSRPSTATSALDRAHAFLRGERRETALSPAQKKPPSGIQRSFQFTANSDSSSSDEIPEEDDDEGEDSADELQEYLSALAKKKPAAASPVTTATRVQTPPYQALPRAAASGYLKRPATAPAAQPLHRIPTLASSTPVPAAASPAVLRLQAYTRPKETDLSEIIKDDGGDGSSDESLGSDFESFLRSPTKRPVEAGSDQHKQQEDDHRASTGSPLAQTSLTLPVRPVMTGQTAAGSGRGSPAVYTSQSLKPTNDFAARVSATSSTLVPPKENDDPVSRASLARTKEYSPAATPPSARVAKFQDPSGARDPVAPILSPSPNRSGLSTPKRYRSVESLGHTRFPSRNASLSPTRRSRSSSFGSNVPPLQQHHRSPAGPSAIPNSSNSTPSYRHSVPSPARRSSSRLSGTYNLAAAAPPAAQDAAGASQTSRPPLADSTNHQAFPSFPPPPPGMYLGAPMYPPPHGQYPAFYPPGYAYPPYPYVYPGPPTAWDPNLAFLHTLMSGHLAYVKAFVASHFAAADCAEFRRKQYMTLADTKKFLKENAREPMSFDEAVRKVDEEQL
ncbi:hypothetical protein HDU86_002300 [Geranomyces michiganensis]|nr:hypothetical protein HDU86_002300 [Geranomyces michiganensis]